MLSCRRVLGLRQAGFKGTLLEKNAFRGRGMKRSSSRTNNNNKENKKKEKEKRKGWKEKFFRISSYARLEFYEGTKYIYNEYVISCSKSTLRESKDGEKRHTDNRIIILRIRLDENWLVRYDERKVPRRVSRSGYSERERETRREKFTVISNNSL